MDNIKKDFESVFRGISRVLDAIDMELDLLKKTNAEQKEELKKNKRFNVIMFVVAIVSLVLSAVSIGVAFA